jgi:hypothetical protein
MARKKASSKKKYGSAASKSVEREMKAYKRGKLKSGRSGATVKSRKQAIAIGLSEARAEGAKVPPAPGKKAAKKKSAKKESAKKKSSGRKKATKKSSKKKSSR